MPKCRYFSKSAKHDLFTICKDGSLESQHKLFEFLSKYEPIHSNRSAYLKGVNLACKHGHFGLVKTFIENDLFTTNLLKTAAYDAEMFRMIFHLLKEKLSFQDVRTHCVYNAIKLGCVDVIECIYQSPLYVLRIRDIWFFWAIFCKVVRDQANINKWENAPRIVKTLGCESTCELTASIEPASSKSCEFLCGYVGILKFLLTNDRYRYHVHYVIDLLNFKDSNHVWALVLLMSGYRIAFNTGTLRNIYADRKEFHTTNARIYELPYVMNRHVVYSHKTDKYAYGLSCISKKKTSNNTQTNLGLLCVQRCIDI